MLDPPPLVVVREDLERRDRLGEEERHSIVCKERQAGTSDLDEPLCERARRLTIGVSLGPNPFGLDIVLLVPRNIAHVTLASGTDCRQHARERGQGS
jgi:hypothetical protein